jgi:hypothetical protein
MAIPSPICTYLNRFALIIFSDGRKELSRILIHSRIKLIVSNSVSIWNDVANKKPQLTWGFLLCWLKIYTDRSVRLSSSVLLNE